jgi:hypothetical protein
MMKRTLALTTTGAVLAASATALAVAPANADGPEKHAHGTVAGARYDISVEKDHGRFEIDADLDGVAAGSSWRMIVRHDGTRVATRTASAVRDDGQYEVDFREVNRHNTSGKDTFKVTLKRTDGPGKVTRKLTLR